MNKIHWSKLADTEEAAAGNRITLSGSYSVELGVKIIDKKGKEIRRHIDTKQGEHEILLIPKIQ
jgi:hypothetical protein